MAKKIMFNDKFGLTQSVSRGLKTMTRRICKEQVWSYSDIVNAENGIFHFEIPRYKVGEVVAIAQSYANLGFNCPPIIETDENGMPEFASESGMYNKMFVRADLMPHHIRITDVRVERLQDISDEDCIKEGIRKYYIGFESYENDYTCFTYSFDETGKYKYPNARAAFAALIDKVSGKGAWDSNPYVFVYEFELVD